MTERYYRLKVEAWLVEEQEDGSIKTVSPPASVLAEGTDVGVIDVFNAYWPILKEVLDASE